MGLCYTLLALLRRKREAILIAKSSAELGGVRQVAVGTAWMTVWTKFGSQGVGELVCYAVTRDAKNANNIKITF